MLMWFCVPLVRFQPDGGLCLGCGWDTEWGRWPGWKKLRQLGVRGVEETMNKGKSKGKGKGPRC